jgi:hypothetical protein
VGVEDEVVVSVFADFCRARLSPVRKSRSIRALALEDLQELLRGQWSDVSEYPYDNPAREERRDCMKSGPRVMIRYSSTHEKTLPNGSIRRRMELHRTLHASPQRIRTAENPRSA